MPKIHRPRAGSLQFWPRKRTSKLLPSVNFKLISEKNPEASLLGFIGYKAGMKTAVVKNLTEHSMIKGKDMIVPVTIIECPPMKIFSVRFYKDNNVAVEILADNPDKELKGKIKLASKENQNKFKEKLEEIEKKIDSFDNVKIICYSLVKKTDIKNVPDLIEIGVGGKTIKEKLENVKKFIGKEINPMDIFKNGQLVDIHAVTKGKGLFGPVKRFGISLRSHKAEKGVRRPGSLGPWHPARVTFRAPLAGQVGLFSRVQYNNKIISHGNIAEKNVNPSGGFKNYGVVRTNYLVIKGSVQGPQKRALFLTYPFRETKKTKKQNLEFLKIV